MYQDLSRNRDEFALAEIEQTLALASQQLQLAGNVRGALIALQNADARLGRADKAQFIAVRRVLQRDIERLKALPFIDTAGLAIRLDTVISSVDTLPLVFDEKLQPQPGRQQRPAPGGTYPGNGGNGNGGNGGNGGNTGNTGADAMGAKPAESGTLQRLRDEVWDQIKQLVRVRDIENAEPVLLSPQQSFFLRENLKLRLLNARLALLSRQFDTAQSDLRDAQAALDRYFDRSSRRVVSALELVRQVSTQARLVNVPRPDATLAAIATANAGR
jgi:uroporphyrin-3 C-methyltransferase/uroporphyrinogen III methyltransferase/synthase